MKYIRILVLVLAGCFGITESRAQQLPVLLMLQSSEQVDTNGCNFVERVTALLYDEIIENRVKLWDSQRKEIQISGSTLKEIENYSGVEFRNQETMFIYEIWENNKKEISCKTVGLSFVHKVNTPEEVVFGYLDYSDLEQLFLKTKINTNASGIYSSTYATYILSKNYVYNIVQFGEKSIKTSGESEDIKKTYIRNLKFNQSLIGYYPPDKYVSYIFDTFTEGADQKASNSRNLIKKLEEYISRNQEIFFNMGGDRISTHLTKSKYKVTKVEVNEMWRIINGEIAYDPKSLVIYVNDSALDELNQRNIGDFGFQFNDMDLFSFLKTRDFNFIITKINSQQINRKDAFLYYKGLLNSEWNKVIQYVVNY